MTVLFGIATSVPLIGEALYRIVYKRLRNTRRLRYDNGPMVYINISKEQAFALPLGESIKERGQYYRVVNVRGVKELPFVFYSFLQSIGD